MSLLYYCSRFLFIISEACVFIHTWVQLTYIVCGNACFHLFMVIYPQEARLLTYWVFSPQFYSQRIRICLQFHEKELLTIFSVFNHGKFQTYKRRKLLCITQLQKLSTHGWSCFSIQNNQFSLSSRWFWSKGKTTICFIHKYFVHASKR